MVFYGDIHVKRGTVVEVFENNNIPEKMHPYTNELRKDALFMNNPEDTLQNNQDKVVRKKIIHTGCVYVNRCPLVQDQCLKQQPPLESMNEENNYFKACFVNN